MEDISEEAQINLEFEVIINDVKRNIHILRKRISKQKGNSHLKPKKKKRKK